MKLSDFDYKLPLELIAQKPLNKRDNSRLMIMERSSGETKHDYFYNLSDYLKKGDVLVVNDSKVFPARLLGYKSTGGKVEFLLNKEIAPGYWEALGKNVKAGDEIQFDKSSLSVRVMKKYEEVCEVKFNLSGEEFFSSINQIGHTPLPPYIKRADDKTDKEEYQTVYAEKIGSAAAPTAGLHFTSELLNQIASRGVITAKVTLNVGLGTFAPVKTEEIEQHKIHSEYFSVTEENLKKIFLAKKEKRRVVAVGTTSTRVLETIFSQYKFSSEEELKNLSGWTEIFIYPGYKFKCVDGLITNFHLPKSTLLMLVSAFAGPANIQKAYMDAIKKGYRFFSYGDAMLII